MTYEIFKQQLLNSLQEFFPKGTRLSIQPFFRNNHLLFDGLTVLEPGSNVSPAIYLNHYYDTLQEGISFSTILSQILCYYYEHCSIRTVDTSFFTCFEQIRPRIAYKLINYQKNRELLKEVPHFPYLDLALVFYCLIQEDSEQSASILIYHKHLEYWNISKHDLLAIAAVNTPILLPLSFHSMADLILPMCSLSSSEECQAAEEFLDSEVIPIYVLTNRQRRNGACCILYEAALQMAAERLKDNLCILPSSIHEVIVIPGSAAAAPQELSQVIQEINLTEVSPEETLSGHAYYYSQISGQISIYGQPDTSQPIQSIFHGIH